MPSRTKTEIEALLGRHCDLSADDLESLDLDFKEWNPGSLNRSVGRNRAILGVPPDVSVNRLKLAVHDGTDPTLTPVFEELMVREGTGRSFGWREEYQVLPPQPASDPRGRPTRGGGERGGLGEADGEPRRRWRLMIEAMAGFDFLEPEFENDPLGRTIRVTLRGAQ